MTVNAVIANASSQFYFGHAQKPDSEFFSAFQQGFREWEQSKTNVAADTATSANSLTNLMGVSHAEMQARRQVSQNDQQRYAAILNQAYGSGGMDDPGRFLGSLSGDDLGVIQRVKGLGAAIDPNSLSREGAYNLLLPEGKRVDFNDDGLSEVGLAAVAVFPPLSAPPEFVEAWRGATEGMSEMDAASYGLSLWGSLHPQAVDHRVQATPSLPTDKISSYRKIVGDTLSSLDAFEAVYDPKQFQRDKAFYTKLLKLLG